MRETSRKNGMKRIVTSAEENMKLRDFLRRVMGVSYTAMKSAKWEGRILVNGEPRTVDQPIHPGETVEFQDASAAPAYHLKPCDRPLNIAYEDEFLWVIDKSAPLASQSSERQPDDTLENMLYAHLNCPEDFIYRPVNRLDKGTSGLMVVAKSAHVQYRLQRMLHTPDFQRVYLAVTEGIPTPLTGTIDAPIAKEDAASIRRVISPAGKPSVTHYQVLEHTATRSLIRLQLETGRTHQIRVHLSSISCPICGDFLYGTELPELPQRFALHSASVTLRHPMTDEMLTVTSPLPEELRSLLA